MTTDQHPSRPLSRWPGFAVAAWGLSFAVPSFVRALGGTAGASSTVAPALVEAAQRHDPGIIAALWATGVLKVVGALLGLALARRRPWPQRGESALRFLAWGAGVLLVWHGLLFIAHGVLVATGALTIADDLRTVSRWYTFLWGPWFVLGGVCFLLGARSRRPLAGDPAAARRAARLGGWGAVALSALILVGGLD
ncbi:DUF3995 domain-containing protein [Kitasatospora sp. NPDC006697]|uniref:DUF3995 domain-containing protein n=1 Tax=Kitasatospora sp. NPDC006697 TaxID=3364020 RepID=UPI00367EDD4A